ncbi:MAG: RsmB/NOP family class I SAM-dependent RNA methyltransferase [Proteobacteria bacterium]|nr:RsmB/NOP family class I SAM-dependent RNA methyltransferase [Pseudomonadota bacterium]
MEEPSNNIKKIARENFESEEAQQLFVNCLLRGESISNALIWTREKPAESPFTEKAALPWQAPFVSHLEANNNPGSHQLHHTGHYYCLDFSSVFEISVVQEVEIKPNFILDLCASPGGKSVFLSQYFHPEILVCNEVIAKRHAQLISNLKRCRILSAVTGRDSKIFADEFPEAFDLVVVDAPCSGQSLIARGNKSPGCFHPSTINLNSNRQKRILANASYVVVEGGYLAYMTCTYSVKENEAVVDWFLNKFPQYKAVEVPAMSEFQSQISDNHCYRLYPQQGLGGGGFAALFKREGEHNQNNYLNLDKLRLIYKNL